MEPTRYYVVRSNRSGKYADVCYGWDHNVHSTAQIFSERYLPYMKSDRLEFICVGEGSKPSLAEALEALDNYNRSVPEAGLRESMYNIEAASVLLRAGEGTPALTAIDKALFWLNLARAGVDELNKTG